MTTKKLNLAIAQRLKELRISLEFTQKKVGKAIGTDDTYISHYESGRRVPSLRNLVKFAKLYNVSTDFLLGLEN